jgi:hypothetical protein
MPLPPAPVARALTPEPATLPPEGFTVLDEALDGGVPHRIPLPGALVAVLVVPTGLASAWLAADAADPVTDSATATSPYRPPPAGDGSAGLAVPARLVVLDGGAAVASLPLVAGACSRVPDDGSRDHGVRLELVVLSWGVLAGTMRGTGTTGARLRIAWRRLGAVDAYPGPEPDPKVIARTFPDAAGGTP